MDEKIFQPLRDRTNAKLRYADVHLKEIREYGQPSGDDFDRAHQESFLFHLLGAKESFILELNVYYGAGQPEINLTAGKLREALEKQGKFSSELSKLYTLENDEASWLFHAKEMRDHSTHVAGVKREYHLGGPADHQVWLRNPKTGQAIQKHFVDEFSDWIFNMRKLLEQLRTSAIDNLKSNSKTETG